MARTFWDQAVHDRATSWRLLRQARTALEVAEADREVFVSALEQSQQLFTAAESVGSATRPLLLYYGLTQGCRALAIALQPGTRFSGHGVKHQNAPTFSDGLEAVSMTTVRSDGKDTGGFNAMGRLLGSALMSEPQSLAYLWGMLLESQLHQPVFKADWPVLHLGSANRQAVSVEQVPAPDGAALDETYFNVLKQRYPEIRSAPFTGFKGSHTDWRGHRVTSIEVPSTDASGNLLSIGRPYRSGNVLMPAIGDEQVTLHPLMVWWAVLYPLSMLCRYEPDRWAQLIDINESNVSAHLETLLEDALDSVPDLLHESLANSSAKWRKGT